MARTRSQRMCSESQLGVYTCAIAMRLNRRSAFSANPVGHGSKMPFRKIRINWEAVTAISTVISVLISLAVMYIAVHALRFTANQIDDYRKESQTQHFIDKAQEFNGSQFRAVRRALAAKRLNRAKDGIKKLDVDDVPAEMFDELAFCNDLGILARHGELNAYDVWGDFSFWLFPFFADAEAVIERDQKDAPASWSNCVYLMEQVRKVDQQEDAGKQLGQQEDDIVGFYYSELEENKSRTAEEAKH